MKNFRIKIAIKDGGIFTTNIQDYTAEGAVFVAMKQMIAQGLVPGENLVWYEE